MRRIVEQLEADARVAAAWMAGSIGLAEFVVELRSPSDRLQALQRRMREFMRSGAMLGWRIDPGRRSVHVYRPGEAIQTLLHPDADAFD